MKATESKKTPGRPRKTTSQATAASKKTGASTTVRKPEATASLPEPTEDEIRAKAQEIYNERVIRGEQGSPDDDWYKAVNALKRQN